MSQAAPIWCRNIRSVDSFPSACEESFGQCQRASMPNIRRLQRQSGLRAPRPRARQRDERGPDEWWPAELVRVLEIPRASLYHWIHQGLVRAHQLDEPLHRWVVWADEAEQERLRQYHQRAIGDDFRHLWTDAPLAEQNA